MSVQSFADLVVWQKSIELVDAAYDVARRFPRDERYALTSQLRRAAISIPGNIAEGYGRFFRREYIYHLSVSRGSVCELQSHLAVAERLGYTPTPALAEARGLADECSRMLVRMRTRLSGMER